MVQRRGLRLGDFLGDPEFRKAVLNKIILYIVRWKTHFSAAPVTRIWMTTPEFRRAVDDRQVEPRAVLSGHQKRRAPDRLRHAGGIGGVGTHWDREHGRVREQVACDVPQDLRRGQLQKSFLRVGACQMELRALHAGCRK